MRQPNRRLLARGGIVFAILFGALSWCDTGSRQESAWASGAGQSDRTANLVVVDEVFARGLKGKWEDWGWAPRDLAAGQPAKLNMTGHGGWLLGNHAGGGSFAALRFKMRAPGSYGDFLEVKLRNRGGASLPAVNVQPRHRRPLADEWWEITIGVTELNPEGLPYDTIGLRAQRSVGRDWVLIDDVVLMDRATTGGGAQAGAQEAVLSEPATMRVDCAATAHRINPMIYGIAYNARRAAQDTFVWNLRPGARRWGGNPASRYNWRLGNAWNTGSDWYFANVNFTGNPKFRWDQVLEENLRRKVATALTVPLLGWVAKDTTSYSFPVTVFGPQQETMAGNLDAGNGQTPARKEIPPGPPTRTSVPFTPEDLGKWVSEIRRLDAESNARHVNMYILDNEPMLWNSTHRDVHPEPVGYDELLQRTIAYGTAIRKADPDAVIAGPALWGWPAYFYSAKDAAVGFRLKPDRRAHGDVPLLAWYLRELAEHEAKTGVRILDVVDVHYYPQAPGVFANDGGGRTDPATAALRVRSTRGLWDPAYVDESWIEDRPRLLPRLQELIEENYPGRGIAIGEYSFGAETHISGGLALAEVLGRYSQFDGLSAAFYWTYPPDGSPAFQAFRAYRDFDGNGGHFQDWSVPTAGGSRASLFASKSENGDHLVLVALNLDSRTAIEASVDVTSCGALEPKATYRFTEGSPLLSRVDPRDVHQEAGALTTTLPPYSLTLFDLQRRLH
jgi:hypothetical protein